MRTMFKKIIIVFLITFLNSVITAQVLQYDAQAILKLISIRVLDKDGNLAMDLTKEDFILFDNDQSKKITEFEVHQLGDFKERSPNYSEKNVIYGGKRKYFIIIDIAGSSILGASNSKKAALHFIETKLNQGDEVCILSYAPMTGLTVQVNLTSDKEKIINAIKRAKEMRSFPSFVSDIPRRGPKPKETGERSPQDELDEGNSNRIEVTRVETVLSKIKSSINPTSSMGSIALYTPSMRKYGRNTKDFRTCLSALTEAMMYIPGNKNVLYFSKRSFGRETGRLFASSNTPVFTVYSEKKKNRGPLTFLQREAHKRAENQMKEFAVASGGYYFPDVKDIEAIADTVDNLSANFYVLGYYIDQQWEGKFHKIKVEIKKPGYQAFVQDGYFDPKPFSQLSDIGKEFHLYDLAYTDKLTSLDAFEMPLEVLHCADEKQPSILILSKLLLDKKIGISPGKIELFFFVFDKEDKLVVSQKGEIDLSTTPQKIFFPYHLTSLKPGEYEGRIVIRNMETGQASVGVSKIEIQEPLKTGIRIYSPLLLVPGNEATFVRIEKEKMKKNNSHSIISYYPLLPQKSSPLVGHLTEGMSRIWAVIPTLTKNNEAPDVEIKVRLIRKLDSHEFDLESDILDAKRVEKNNMDALLLEIHLPELKPGEYELEITASEFISQTESVVKIPLMKKENLY